MLKKTTLTPQQALQKLKHYCGYQERCHQEVKNKLYEYGLSPIDVDTCICTLIEENYLNEERFAIAYAGGKFRTKNWGKVKIKYHLAQKQISAYCIKKALAVIDEDDYLVTLEKEFEKKLSTLRSEKNIFNKKRKLSDYLRQHGFESNLINDLMKKL
jgi:regulatory protein